jgi:hypothetical protein
VVELKAIEGFARVYDDKDRYKFDYSAFIYDLRPNDEALIPEQREHLLGGRTRRVRLEFLD